MKITRDDSGQLNMEYIIPQAGDTFRSARLIFFMGNMNKAITAVNNYS